MRKAFTLVELLVVIAIIGILVGLLLPSVQAAREASRRVQCSNNLKQLGLANQNFHQAHGQIVSNRLWWAVMPPSNLFSPPGANKGSWLVHLLPYLEQNNLWAAFANSEPSSSELDLPGGQKPLVLGRCPSDEYDPAAALSNYVGNLGPHCMYNRCSFHPWSSYCTDPNAIGAGQSPGVDFGDTLDARLVKGVFSRFGARITFEMVRDGLSNTLVIGESLPVECDHVTGSWIHWNSHRATGTTIIPINYRTDGVYDIWQWANDAARCTSDPARSRGNWDAAMGFKSRHPGGANFALLDGSVRLISEGIDHLTLQRLGCRNDGLPLVQSF